MLGVALAILLCATPAYAEIIIANTARVTGGSSAIVSTGDNDVEPGGIIETGDAEARAYSHSAVTGEGGVVETTAETVVNGVRTVDTRTAKAPAGETITVRAATSSKTGGIIIREHGTTTLSQNDVPRMIESEPTLETQSYVSSASLVNRIASFLDRIFARVALLAWWR